MIFPIGTDRSLRHTPWVNYSLIAANTVAFILTTQVLGPRWYEWLMLHPSLPQTHQFISYQFLHADWLHLVGNMIFLYIFGNHVEDRLGKLGYIAFYLAGGTLAGLGHCVLEVSPVVGASGAVTAVTGAFLAMFPLTEITLFVFFFFIGAFQISSLYLIGFQVAIDFLMFLARAGGVAYLAHLTGYAMGFAVGMGLLYFRLLPREPYDMMTLLAQQHRRAQFRQMTQRGYSPWQGGQAAVPNQAARRGGRKGVWQGDKGGELDGHQQKLATARRELADSVMAGNSERAAERYQALQQLSEGSVLSQRQQRDLANLLMAHAREQSSTGAYELAADAYEGFLRHYSSDPEAEPMRLLLAVVYVRHLDRPQAARPLLEKLLNELTDPEQKAIAQNLQQQVEAAEAG